jgi:arginine decarboxylase
MKDYGIDIWSDNNFFVKKDTVNLNTKSEPSLLEIVQKVRLSGLRGPLVLRFPHLIKKQINTLFTNFKRSLNENEYQGDFFAVYPLKVNQYPNVIDSVLKYGEKYNYGLEAGSKAELALAIAKTPIGSPITVNGFKDQEMITMGYMAAHMGHNITLTIEGLNELKSIIEVSKLKSLKLPNIGIRIRLNSSGSGAWAKSSGMDAKFGLTSTEILEAFSLLRNNNLLHKFTMIHFHIGSQMEDILPLKKALREAGNIYAELKKMGAHELENINIGGGLSVEYSQHNECKMHNVSIEEFSNDVVFVIKTIMDAKNVAHPNIFTESGRYIVASHAILITPVLELFSQDFQLKSLRLKQVNPPLIEELHDLLNLLNKKNALEYLHDAFDHMQSLFSLFELGYIDLQDRSNAEILAHQIIKKVLTLMKDKPIKELLHLQHELQERYLVNSSFFQSLPDYWGLGQRFPVMPLDHLDKPALRAASLWDITCDSDGEIPFDTESGLYLHDVNLEEEEYFLAFFNIGAYQETLGMNHNLFSHPSECTIILDEYSYKIEKTIESDSILSILTELGYDSSQILIQLKNNLSNALFTTEEEKNDTLSKLELYVHQNSYLNSI